MSWGLVAGAVIAGVGAAKSASATKKAARISADASRAAQIDPAEVSRLASEQALLNIRNSLGLEQQFTPENAALRSATIRQLLSRASSDPTGDQATGTVQGLLSRGDPQSQLFNDALRMAGEDLAMGGRLPVDVRNEVARTSIANAGRVGGGQLGLARFTTPRDLGLTSLALRDSRLNRASQLGQQEVQNAGNASTLRSQLAALLANLGSNQTNRQLSLASFGQTLQPPQAGLSPGDIVSLFTNNASNTAQAGQNAAALTAQQGRNTAQLFGGLGGMVAGVDWSKIFGAPATVSTPAPAPVYGQSVFGKA